MNRIGCIADDFTGASDAASFYTKGGGKTAFFASCPTEDINAEASCLVVALKTRTQELTSALNDVKNTYDWLIKQGCNQIYIKYCSTFDSTKEGNIGPICDYLLEELNIPYTILCPALPINGRTIKDGHLFVNNVPLNESSMKDHPLTPMWDSFIPSLMKEQSKYPCYVINGELLEKSNDEIFKLIDNYKKENKHFYLVVDCYEDKHMKKIAKLFSSLKLLTGGSGLLEELAKENQSVKRGLCLAASCSSATLEQIANYDDKKSYKINVFDLLNNKIDAQTIWKEASKDKTELLIYASSSKEERINEKDFPNLNIGKIIEDTIAQIALLAKNSGTNRIIVAGGETSGAVCKALGFKSFKVGKEVAPGVPILTPYSDENIKIVLKSGNFGSKDFFSLALKMSEEELELKTKINDAINVAASIFNRNKTTGSSANMSFRHAGCVYITRSGASFGNLCEEDFSILSLDGKLLKGAKPSKEYPMHLNLLNKRQELNAIIHTHSTYAVLWSTLNHENEQDCIPTHTPYLKMRVGTIGLIDYYKPGSEELFKALDEKIMLSDGYILKNHGAVIGGKDILDAFYNIEETEESAKIAWKIKFK